MVYEIKNSQNLPHLSDIIFLKNLVLNKLWPFELSLDFRLSPVTLVQFRSGTNNCTW